jgi:GTP cyclohydrolase I
MSDTSKEEIKEIQQAAGIPPDTSLTTAIRDVVQETIIKEFGDSVDDSLEATIKKEVAKSFRREFPSAGSSAFDIAWEQYTKIECFPALGNVADQDVEVDKETHYVMRSVAAWHLEKALRALKFDTTNDPNLKSDDEMSNIGTAGRVAKIWGGKGLDPENVREFGDGRWTKQPRLAAFPASDGDKGKPVTVVIDNPGIGSVCSHHFLPYGIVRDGNSKIIISYIPNAKLLGLSKIGRFVEWCLNRPSLQEEVTTLIHKKIEEIASSKHVYVGLINMVHTCETTRGAKQYSTTTTESFGGDFDDVQKREAILRYT